MLACLSVMAGLEFFVARHLVESCQAWGACSYLPLQYAKACRHRIDFIFRYPSTCSHTVQRTLYTISSCSIVKKWFKAHRNSASDNWSILLHGASYSMYVLGISGSTQLLALLHGPKTYMTGSTARLLSIGQMVAIVRPAIVNGINNSSYCRLKRGGLWHWV